MHTQENSWLNDVANDLPALADYKTISSLCGMSKGSLANLCSQGDGIKGGVIIGKKKMFPRREVLKWMGERAELNAKQMGA